MDPDDLLSSDDLTQILNIPPDTLASWIEQGLLKPITAGDTVRFHVENIRALAASHLASEGHGSRILVIEDDPLVAKSLKVLLEKSGFEVMVVPVGLAVLDFAAREPFDLILTDIKMPGMNGIETLKAIRELRSQFGLPQLPEIVLTAYEDDKIREETKRMGISDFLLKPFDFNDLMSAIARNLKHAA